MTDLHELTAVDAARMIAGGEIKSEQLVRSLIAVISAREGEVNAWAHFDADYALEQARKADLMHENGWRGGPLHGVPVAVKDIIDTADMPTENGTVLHQGRRPSRDATVIRLLREAGAVIMGKTVTAELAVLTPGKTANPHDPSRTPGGSSSGSAAAVAAKMVPLALGTQTNGSVIRPASYCGVYGFKPSFGLISRHGVLRESPALDTIGFFARTIEDLALTTEVLARHDPADSAMVLTSRSPIHAIATSDAPIAPSLAFIKTPFWDKADAITHDAFSELAGTLAAAVTEIRLPGEFARAADWQRAVMYADIARHYGPLYDQGKAQLSPLLCGIIEEGRTILAADYNRARDAQSELYDAFEALFDRFDAVLTPSAPGPAPVGLGATGNPIFSTLWTFMGVPALSMPLLEADGMPLGVQLVGRRGDDARLLRTANWLVRFLRDEAG